MSDPVSSARHLCSTAHDMHAVPLTTITRELTTFASQLRSLDNNNTLLQSLASHANLHPLNLANSLAHWARQISPAPLTQLVRAELHSPDPFTPRANPETAVSSMWIPPTLTLHSLPDSHPLPTLDAIVESTLARSPTLLRTSAADKTTPILHKLLVDHCPTLARFVAITHWPSNNNDLTQNVASLATNVVVWGNDSTIQNWKTLAPPTTRIITRGHRVSCTIIGPHHDPDTNTPAPSLARTLAAAIATDTALLDQRGCMSPHTIFIHTNSQPTLTQLADELANHALPHIDNTLPRAPLDHNTAAQVMQLRGSAEFSGHARTGPSFTLVLHSSCQFHHSPPARVLHLVPYSSLTELHNALEPLKQHLSTTAIFPHNNPSLIHTLATLGSRRICAPGRMQRPLLLRHHDGIPRISPLIHLMDIEPQQQPAPLCP